MLALRILPQAVFSPSIGDGATGSRADAYGDDQQLAFLRFFGNFQRGVHGVLAIAQYDQRIGAPLRGAALEILHGLAEHKPEVRAAHAGPVAVDLLQCVTQRCVVVGQRHNEVGLAGEDNQTDFVAGQGIN